MRPHLAFSPGQVQFAGPLPMADLGSCSSPAPTSHTPTSPRTTPCHLQRLQSLLMQTPVRSQTQLVSPRSRCPGPARALSSHDLTPSRAPKLSKFLDATVHGGDNQPLAPVVLQAAVPTTPKGSVAAPSCHPASVAAPSSAAASSRARSSSVQPCGSRASPGVGLQENSLKLIATKLEETMAEQLQKLSSALDASQEERAAAMASQMRQVEERWAQGMENERLERERQLKDLVSKMRLPVAQEAAVPSGSLGMDQVPALAEFTEFTSATIKDLTTRMDALRVQADAAAAGIAARKTEAVSTIERLHLESLAKQQEQLQQHAAATGSVIASAAPTPALQLVEAKFQEVMEQQILKLTTTLSSAVEQRVAQVSGEVRQAEGRWAEAVHSLEAKFEVLREQSEGSKAGICDQREELAAMIRSASAELCGSLTQQQQQQQELRRLRQQMQEEWAQKSSQLAGPDAASAARLAEQQAAIDALQQQVCQLQQGSKVLPKQSPQSVESPELTPQAQTPHEFETALELAGGLRDVKKDLQRVEAQVQRHLDEVEVCKHLLNANREASEHEVLEIRSALQAHQNDLDTTSSEVSTCREEIQTFHTELETIQTSVVQRVGEACNSAMQEWKECRQDDVCRLEERLPQLSSELKAEREDRCKSIAELRLQCVQLNATAVDSTTVIKAQTSRLAHYTRAVEQLQIKCQCLPEPAES